jgi:hypothetical protein
VQNDHIQAGPARLDEVASERLRQRRVIEQASWERIMRPALKLRCGRTHGRKRLNAATGELVRTHCRCWKCASCAEGNRCVAQVLMEAGLFYAVRRNDPCWHVTLTSRAGVGATDWIEAMRRMSGRVCLRPHFSNGVWAFDVTNRGALHVHWISLGPEPSQAMFEHEAAGAGLGFVRITQPRPGIADARFLANYVASGLPAAAAALHESGITRIRPVTFGRGWPAGGLTAGREIAFALLRDGRITACVPTLGT